MTKIRFVYLVFYKEDVQFCAAVLCVTGSEKTAVELSLSYMQRNKNGGDWVAHGSKNSWWRSNNAQHRVWITKEQVL